MKKANNAWVPISYSPHMSLARCSNRRAICSGLLYNRHYIVNTGGCMDGSNIDASWETVSIESVVRLCYDRSRYCCKSCKISQRQHSVRKSRGLSRVPIRLHGGQPWNVHEAPRGFILMDSYALCGQLYVLPILLVVLIHLPTSSNGF